MNNRGLAAETAAALGNAHGVHAVTRRIGDVTVTDVTVSEDAHKRVNQAAGRYITLDGEPHYQGMCGLLQRAITQVIPPRGRLFAVGLGNPDVTYDRLGAQVVRALTARKGRRYALCAIETDVAARTGIETARLVRAAARELRPDCVIVFDALSCADPRRIGKTVQITDAGLIPGSGAGNPRTEITANALGMPIAAVGVPTITPLSAITNHPEHATYHVTPHDIDVLVTQWSSLLADAIDLIIGDT